MDCHEHDEIYVKGLWSTQILVAMCAACYIKNRFQVQRNLILLNSGLVRNQTSLTSGSMDARPTCMAQAK